MEIVLSLLFWRTRLHYFLYRIAVIVDFQIVFKQHLRLSLIVSENKVVTF